MVKIGRMSAGSSEVDLWGGTGALYTIQGEDANFYFIKAAVDPTKNVEESDGDTKPGIITELLYRIDTDENEDDEPKSVIRRRRQQSEEEESQQVASDISPWRKRHRPAELTLQIPDSTRARRREASNESSYTATKRSPIEEYKPMSFSTNRWRTKKDEATENKLLVEEYKPSSFATNRWRVKSQEEAPKTTTIDEYKPSRYSTNRWLPKSPEESSVSVVNGTAEDTKPSSYSTNRWRTRTEDTDTKISLDVSPYSTRKTSTDEKTDIYSTSRWRTRTQDPQPIKVELRKTIGVDDNKSTSSLPYLRRRESTENKLPELPYLRRRESSETKTPEMPAFLRKRSTTTVDENKTSTPFGRSRWGSTATSSPSEDTTTRSRFLPTSTKVSSYSTTQPTDSYSTRRRDSSAARYGSTRESSLSKVQDLTSHPRTRESSLSRARDSSSSSRFGPSSISSLGSSYLNRYDTSTTGGTDSGYSSVTNKYGTSGSSPKKYAGAGSDFSFIRSRFGSPLSNEGTDLNSISRYRSSSIGVKDVGAGSRYGSSSYSGRSDLGSSSRYNISLSSKGKDTDYSSGLSRYSSSLSSKASDPTFKSTGRRYSNSVLTPTTSSSGYDGSRRRGTDSSSYIYGNENSDSLKYGGINSRYNISSSRN